MPLVEVNGVELYYEEAGGGFPLVWNHEFAGDCRSLDLQVRQFARRYRVITYNYRGWPPSSVPDDVAAYSTESLVDDLAGLLRHLRVPRAHIAGLAMGGNIALAFAARFPKVVASLIVAGCGSGTVDHEAFVVESERLACVFETRGARVAGDEIAQRPGRQVYAVKDPLGYQDFVERLHAHSPRGAAAAIRGVLVPRKTIVDMAQDLRGIAAPTLVIVGDRDDGAIEASLFMRRTMPHASVVMLPFTGHVPNLEEPTIFNFHVSEFLAAVSEGCWADWRRDAAMTAQPGRG
jgi:pimeloyl-ACP methyl ester carboxylesterase